MGDSGLGQRALARESSRLENERVLPVRITAAAPSAGGAASNMFSGCEIMPARW